ncbi:MAG TPA: serine hydrolase domain-containing protein [Caulobacteraceae bacterium]|nr:serine hydrolase domain-containing protein [Caulobacteraceae bacterium]
MTKPATLPLTLLLCLGGLAPGPVLAQPAAATRAADADMRRYAEDLLARNYPAEGPGAAVLVARGDTVLFRGARGEADVERHTPLRPDSVLRIGSVTKQFAAAGLLTLVEAGKVKLDDPLSRYLPDYPGGDRITVRQLLNHTSGVKSYTDMPGYMATSIGRDLTTAQMIDVFDDATPDFAPGAGWTYSNSGYVLVGAVIEAASGMPWHAYLEEALFRPLGMRRTGYGHDPRFTAMQAGGYSFDGERVTPMQPMSMTQPHAAGALVSTVEDLHKWNRALHRGRVVKADLYRQMITPGGPAAAPGIGYGFGIYAGTVRNRPALRHNGAIFGFASSLYYLPGPDITVVVLENDDASNSPETADTVARRLAAMAMGDPYPAPRPVPVALADLQAAQAVYRFPSDVTRTLRVVDGQLTAQRGQGPRTVLIPIAADEFLYQNGFDRLVVQRGADGAVSGVRFFPRGEGSGEVGVRTADPLDAAPIAVGLPRAALDRVVGVYARGGLTMKVFLEGGLMKAQIVGQEPVDLRALSATRFESDLTGASFEFPETGSAAAEVTVRQNGREIVLRRTP